MRKTPLGYTLKILSNNSVVLEDNFSLGNLLVRFAELRECLNNTEAVK